MAAKKNEVYPLRIEGYGSAGEGVARLDGQAVFVKGALAGELCQVQLLKVGKSAAWGRVAEVTEPSPGRQVPDCPQYPKCGGCQLRHMTYAEELNFKRQKVQDALQRIGGWDGAVSVIHGAAQPDRYRNKIQFPVADGPRVGFFRARSHDVIDCPDCLLQPLPATHLRSAFRAWMADCHVPAYDEKAHEGLIRHFYVRVNQKGQSLCAVIANGKRLPQQDKLIEALRVAEPGLVGVVLSVNQAKTNVILGKEYHTLWGQDFLEDTLCDLNFRLSVPSFYQVNRDQAEVLYGRALDFAQLTGTETVLDLYCGIGTITLVLARRAGKAIGAEVIPAAIEDAKANAARNGVTNTEFLCADAGEAAQSWPAGGCGRTSSAWTRPARASPKKSSTPSPKCPPPAWSTSPATPPRWRGTWRDCGRRAITCSRPRQQTCFREQGMWRRLSCFPRVRSTQKRFGLSSLWKIWICPNFRMGQPTPRLRTMCWSIAG